MLKARQLLVVTQLSQYHQDSQFWTPDYPKFFISYKNQVEFHMMYHLFLHHGRFVQNLGKDFIPTNMHTTVNTHKKSDNLQYSTLGPSVYGTNNSLTKCLMFQALFVFIISYRLRALKSLYFCKIIK